MRTRSRVSVRAYTGKLSFFALFSTPSIDLLLKIPVSRPYSQMTFVRLSRLIVTANSCPWGNVQTSRWASISMGESPLLLSLWLFLAALSRNRQTVLFFEGNYGRAQPLPFHLLYLCSGGGYYKPSVAYISPNNIEIKLYIVITLNFPSLTRCVDSVLADELNTMEMIQRLATRLVNKDKLRQGGSRKDKKLWWEFFKPHPHCEAYACPLTIFFWGVITAVFQEWNIFFAHSASRFNVWLDSVLVRCGSQISTILICNKYKGLSCKTFPVLPNMFFFRSGVIVSNRLGPVTMFTLGGLSWHR